MIEIDPKILGAQVVTFLIGIGLLWKPGFKNIAAVLEKRKQQIAQDLEQAAAARLEMDRLKANHDAQLLELKRGSEARLEAALREANEQRAQILEATRIEAQALLHKTRGELEAERERAARALKGEVAGLACQVAGKLVGRSLDDQLQRQLVDQFIAELERPPQR